MLCPIALQTKHTSPGFGKTSVRVSNSFNQNRLPILLNYAQGIG